MPFLQRPDVGLYYEVSEPGVPILLIQGIGTCGQAWRPQIHGLRDEFQALFYDNRGIGKSVPCRGEISIETMTEDTRALLDAAGWKSAHVVGHSMGGVIAQQLALDCPRRVRSLTLLCTFACGREAIRLTPRVLWMTLRTWIGSRRMRRRAFLEMLLPKALLQGADLDVMASEYGHWIGRDLADQPAILLKQAKAVMRHDTSRRLGELAGIPTLVISADQDSIARPRYGKRLADLIPGARFQLIANASHGVIIHDPDRVNQELRPFLRQAEARFTSA